MRIMNTSGEPIEVTALNREKAASVKDAGDNVISLPCGVYIEVHHVLAAR